MKQHEATKSKPTCKSKNQNKPTGTTKQPTNQPTNNQKTNQQTNNQTTNQPTNNQTTNSNPTTQAHKKQQEATNSKPILQKSKATNRERTHSNQNKNHKLIQPTRTQ